MIRRARHVALAFAATLVTLLAPDARAQGRVATDTLHSRALRGNAIGDSPDREVFVYLPPSYERERTRRYPTLYLLHGLTSKPIEWLDGSYQGFDISRAMDSLATAGSPEFIVVMPDADNAYGGTFYVDSKTFGKWDEFTSKELVKFIDGRYRTIADRSARGLAGHSMGGFGALHLVARHPDVWSTVYVVSACCLGFVGEFAPDGRAWRAASASARQPSDSSLRRRVPSTVAAMAAAFSPRAERPPFIAHLPFTVDSLGSVHEDKKLVKAWTEQFPIERLSHDRKALSKLDAIGIEFGTEDQIASVIAGSREYAHGLAKLGIAHTFEEYEGGHIDRVRERFEGKVLPFFAKAFASRVRARGHGR